MGELVKEKNQKEQKLECGSVSIIGWIKATE
jgi:hypothetical protein